MIEDYPTVIRSDELRTILAEAGLYRASISLRRSSIGRWLCAIVDSDSGVTGAASAESPNIALIAAIQDAWRSQHVR